MYKSVITNNGNFRDIINGRESFAFLTKSIILFELSRS